MIWIITVDAGLDLISAAEWIARGSGFLCGKILINWAIGEGRLIGSRVSGGLEL